MTTYLDVYQDARRKLDPISSLNYAINDAKVNHPSLKQFQGEINNE